MGINSMCRMEAFGKDYYAYDRLPNIRNNDDNLNKQDSYKAPEEDRVNIDVALSEVIPRTRSNVEYDNISLVFNATDDFAHIGINKDINALDIKQAISDMRADKILEDYQYFVGDRKGILEFEEGVVIPKGRKVMC